MKKIMCINGKMVEVENYRYGCFNRPPLATTVQVQDGWTKDGRRKMKTIPNPMTKHCVYGKDYGHSDPSCEGCKHLPKEV